MVLADSLIEQAEYEKASKIIIRLSSNLKSRYSSYRVIKRAINISEKTNNYTVYESVSKNAVEKYPGNEDLVAYYTMALIKNKKYSLAYDIADKNLFSDEFKPLLAEIVLHKEIDGKNFVSFTDYIENKKDPAFFEYLAKLLNNNSLIINSSLLWAKNGDLEKAYSLIMDKKVLTNSELPALLAYDLGKNSEALNRFLELPINDSIKFDNILLIADLFYIKGNWSRSRYYYEKAIEIDPYYANPYLNISSIYLKGEGYKQALDIIEKGISNFKSRISTLALDIDNLNDKKDSGISDEEHEITVKLINKYVNEKSNLRLEYRKLILLAHNLYKEIGSNKKAIVLQDYRNYFPDDVKVQLLEMRELNNKIDPDILIAKLWKLLNKDENPREVSEYLIWYLLGLGNFDDINLVLERNEHRHPKSSWTEYYRAILLSLNGDYQESINMFNKTEDTWDNLYNKGVIQIALLNYSEALTLFNKSIIKLNQLDFVNNKNKYLSKIKTKQAQVLINLHDTEEAIRILNSAFELDPENYSSDLLKSVNLNLEGQK